MLNCYKWNEIDSIPQRSGIYSWYLNLQISQADIVDVIQKVRIMKEESFEEAKNIIERFINKFILNPYKEDPYEVLIKGKLKPKYNGLVHNDQNEISEILVLKILDNPDILYSLVNIISGVSPYFNSPLYIGMAKDLRKRLKQHKTNIIKLKENGTEISFDLKNDAGFARQVVSRNMNYANLFVHIAYCDTDNLDPSILENILNRINYPIFGRN
ncbi:hypothetical protein [Acinetobacter courvalinii]|uniref:GIY-YIG domain-containing protein n=1 Tax=Acinetobacter courvalinii TaxID=280147 RepID=N9RLP2_9GAMM|nr:hypothetical protein [Acinetobacter courvalinii]ENX40067.1 hypothetical protein F888_00707 [Acinetobacter courvalinii]KAB0660747.1 hypothetical protein F7P77_03525 [Acinetobacter courvalinii]GGH36808.1 hypothetical protein GCM10007354_20940 [Acinetobacter courvalinii]